MPEAAFTLVVAPLTATPLRTLTSVDPILPDRPPKSSSLI